MKSLRAQNVSYYAKKIKINVDAFGALVLSTLHLKYVSTCFLVEHPFEIDVLTVACLVDYKH